MLTRTLLLLLLFAGTVHAQGRERPEPGVLGLLGPDSVTTHSLAAAGGAEKIDYTATAGTLPLYDASGARMASIFYTSYVRSGDAAPRPVTFVFNGGPGAASAYLHLGLVGPRLLQFDAAGDGGRARLVDNPQSWLGFTDLVIIDPIGTGWSRTAKPDDAAHFWAVREDADAMAKAIALWVAHAGRSAAPLFLLGESYGGMRAIETAYTLQHEQGLVVSGMILISPLLDGALVFGADRLPLGAALKLPSLAAGELIRTGTFTAAAEQAAEHFAMTDYLTTLAGPPLTGAAADAFYARVAALTGVPQDAVARSHGFLGRDALRPAHEEISVYDATVGVDAAFGGGPGRGDLVLDGFTRAFGGAFVGYAHDTLGFRTDVTYELLNSNVSRHWNWHEATGGLYQPRADDDLADLLAVDSGLRVMIASGYGDLIIPFTGIRYVVDHMGAAPGRVVTKVYPGGHMIYLTDASRLALTTDAQEFIAAQSAAGSAPATR